jgi:hypothetical protein
MYELGDRKCTFALSPYDSSIEEAAKHNECYVLGLFGIKVKLWP